MPVNEQHRAIRKILIVDDIEDNCLLIEDHLRHQLKCEFREASSGKAALKILENWHPDCILMDIMMPEMDGIEATKRLKEMPECQDIPVLMVTAKQEMDSLVDAFDRIKELNQQLLQKKQELSSFSHTVSHDLKSPIVGAASLYDLFLYRIKNEYPQLIEDESLKDILERIPQTFHKMLDFINTQLDYAEAGQVIGELEKVSMTKLINTVIENFDYAEREGMVSFVNLPEMPPVMCDPIRMLKVWQNLIANSIKYRGSKNPVKIEFGSRKNNVSTNYWIRDNGPGILAEHQDKVFETNARLNYDVEGYGFGLATVKKIVEAHGGKIWIDSDVNDGACFVCELPHESVNN